MTETVTRTVLPFEQAEAVTLLGVGHADPAYCGNLPISMGVRLPDGRMLVAGPGWPGVTLIHGDIRPTLLQALRDAIEYRDCRSSDECADWRDQYEKAIDVIEAADP